MENGSTKRVGSGVCSQSWCPLGPVVGATTRGSSRGREVSRFGRRQLTRLCHLRLDRYASAWRLLLNPGCVSWLAAW